MASYSITIVSLIVIVVGGIVALWLVMAGRKKDSEPDTPMLRVRVPFGDIFVLCFKVAIAMSLVSFLISALVGLAYLVVVFVFGGIPFRAGS